MILLSLPVVAAEPSNAIEEGVALGAQVIASYSPRNKGRHLFLEKNPLGRLPWQDRDFLATRIALYGLAPSKAKGSTLVIYGGGSRPTRVDYSRFEDNVIQVDDRVIALDPDQSLEWNTNNIVIPMWDKKDELSSWSPTQMMMDVLAPGARFLAFMSACTQEQRQATLNSGLATGSLVSMCIHPSKALWGVGHAMYAGYKDKSFKTFCKEMPPVKELRTIGDGLKTIGSH
jgi:hypothetical protein